MAKKYIDAEKLKTKVKKLNLVTKTYEEQVAFNNALAMVVEIIDSLQQEQLSEDMDEEITSFIEKHYHIRYDETLENGDAFLTTSDFEDIAKHFYNLGKNAK